MVIYDAKNVNLEWTRGEVPGTGYAANSWLSDHILKHAVAVPTLILLLLDRHGSH